MRLCRLLEVGALKPDNYTSCQAWTDVTPIDLHSQHPSILEQDFLLMDPEEHREKWGAISLSLVLNFVPDAKDRGEDGSSNCTPKFEMEVVSFLGQMLRLAHNMLHPGGLLFVAVCHPCHASLSTPRSFTEDAMPVASTALYPELQVYHSRTLRGLDGCGRV